MQKKWIHRLAVGVLFTLCMGLIACQNVPKDMHTHAWKKISETEVTCTTAGIKMYRCDCGEEKIVTAPPIGHDYQTIAAQEVTCVDDGWEEHTACVHCGEGEVVKYPALGHDYVHYGAQKVTCTEKGWAEYDKCRRCEYSTKIEVAALGHNWETLEVVKKATCSQDGSMIKKCSHCGKEKEEKIVATGHRFYSVSAKEPTCTEIGWDTYKQCSVCEYSTKEELPMIDHTWDEGKEGIYGITYTCQVCEEVWIEGDGHTHDWEKDEILTEPTCEKKGEELYVCECGMKKKVSIDKLGHEEEVIDREEPTCIEYGKTEGARCSRCEKILLEPTLIEPLGHTETEIGGIEPTCIENGCTAGKYCVICDEITEEQRLVPALGHEWKVENETEIETFYFCERCKEKKSELKKDHKHEYEELISSTQSDCTTGGKIVKACQCGAQKTTNLAPLGHDYVNGICTRCGTIDETYEVEISIEESSSFEEETQKDSLSSESSVLENSVVESSELESNEENSSTEEDTVDTVDTNLLMRKENGGYVCLGAEDETCHAVVIPDTYNGLPVVEIAEGAFEENYYLNSVVIGKNVEKIDTSSFFGCRNLVEVYNRSSLSEEEIKATMYWANYLTVYDRPFTSKIKRITGFIVYESGEENILIGYEGEGTHLSIPVGITLINARVFCTCEGLKTLNMNNGTLETIGAYAFEWCKTLEKITIGASVKTITKRAFKGVTSLEYAEFEWQYWNIGGPNELKNPSLAAYILLKENAKIDCVAQEE